MLFKNPELLYALFLLVIPIIVHLFQLRRFKKEQFTNVKFLKKVQLQTRKSSQIKKWLTLLARILALACIILAFAQPYFPASNQSLQEKEMVIYLDNSFSMQQKGKSGELLKKSIQDLLTQIPTENKFTLLTNNNVYRNTTITDLKSDLQKTNYTSTPTNFKTTYLKAQNLFSKRKEVLKKFVAISDFQQQDIKDVEFSDQIENTAIQLEPENSFNISIDSAFVKEQHLDHIELQVNVSSNSKSKQLFPISLFNNESLLAKSSVSFEEKTTANAIFSIENKEAINGKFTVNDNSLQYDNSLYFSLQQNEKIKVIAINGNDSQFLNKIYTNKEFDLISVEENKINYNQLENQHLIVLNELKSIPNGLNSILAKHLDNGGYVAIIPSKNIDQNSYRSLLNTLGVSVYNNSLEEELKITTINFSHPLYKNVFNQKIKNFDYPKVNNYYPLASASNPILSFNNGLPFLKEQNHVYLFSSAINKENSNFKNSPLIVPTFYNIAKQSLQLPKLYYVNNRVNTIEISAALQEDEVIKVKDSSFTFIPLQKRFSNKVELTFQEEPKKAGNYSLITKNEALKNISFNEDRKESELIYADLSSYKNLKTNNSITNFFTQEINANEMNLLWKWFVIFALLFLVIEFLLLKYLK